MGNNNYILSVMRLCVEYKDLSFNESFDHAHR